VLEFFRFLTRDDNLYRYASGQPEGTGLSFPTRPVPLLPDEQAFLDSARLGGEPLQGGVKYIMGQWMEIEADFESMLAGALDPAGFLSALDARRANMAAAARDPSWPSPLTGASQLRILVRVVTPLAMPMIATIAIIGFQSMWNELPFSLLILQNQGSRTLTLGIAMMRGEYGLRVPILSASVVIAMAVPLVIFLIFQRRITLGVTAGAIKG
jgi:hypothetical protein